MRLVFRNRVEGYRRMSGWGAFDVVLVWIETSAIAQNTPYPPVVTFAVFRNGENIGRHTIAFQQKGDARIVTVDVDITVRTLGVQAYRYVHHGTEVWVGDQLQSLQTTTED